MGIYTVGHGKPLRGFIGKVERQDLHHRTVTMEADERGKLGKKTGIKQEDQSRDCCRHL